MRPTSTFPRQHLSTLFLTGKTPTRALQKDRRFSYALYVPDAHYHPTTSPGPASKLHLIIVIHGTRRDHLAAQDSLIPLADSTDTACAILAPLFPVGITGPEDLSSYKRLVAEEDDAGPVGRSGLDTSLSYEDAYRSKKVIRYDEILLAMVDEVAQRYGDGIETATFHLAGFSGGGQFVHRFLYLHPDRIISASVGAPGDITLLSDTDRPPVATGASLGASTSNASNPTDQPLTWPRGTSNMQDHFPHFAGIDIHALRRVRLQIIIGQEDVKTELFKLVEVMAENRPDKRPRLEKARELYENWRAHGLNVTLDEVLGVAHSRVECKGVLVGFLGKSLSVAGRE